jgi:hypothetical protein
MHVHTVAAAAAGTIIQDRILIRRGSSSTTHTTFSPLSPIIVVHYDDPYYNIRPELNKVLRMSRSRADRSARGYCAYSLADSAGRTPRPMAMQLAKRGAPTVSCPTENGPCLDRKPLIFTFRGQRRQNVRLSGPCAGGFVLHAPGAYLMVYLMLRFSGSCGQWPGKEHPSAPGYGHPRRRCARQRERRGKLLHKATALVHIHVGWCYITSTYTTVLGI